MRLTKKVEDKAVFHVCDKTCLSCDGTSCGFTQAIVDRLAAYEDTGLEPDEIKENIGLMSPICVGCDGKTADGKRTEKCTYVDDDFRKCLERSVHLSELAHAEERGRLVVLPCKVGDTVWTLNHHYRPVDGKVQSIHQNYVGDRAGRWVLTSFFPEYYGQAESGLDPDFIPATRYFGIEDFGKTVFLTREEAEAALKGETEDV